MEDVKSGLSENSRSLPYFGYPFWSVLCCHWLIVHRYSYNWWDTKQLHWQGCITSSRESLPCSFGCSLPSIRLNMFVWPQMQASLLLTNKSASEHLNIWTSEHEPFYRKVNYFWLFMAKIADTDLRGLPSARICTCSATVSTHVYKWQWTNAGLIGSVIVVILWWFLGHVTGLRSCSVLFNNFNHHSQSWSITGSTQDSDFHTEKIIEVPVFHARALRVGTSFWDLSTQGLQWSCIPCPEQKSRLEFPQQGHKSDVHLAGIRQRTFTFCSTSMKMSKGFTTWHVNSLTLSLRFSTLFIIRNRTTANARSISLESPRQSNVQVQLCGFHRVTRPQRTWPASVTDSSGHNTHSKYSRRWEGRETGQMADKRQTGSSAGDKVLGL